MTNFQIQSYLDNSKLTRVRFMNNFELPSIPSYLVIQKGKTQFELPIVINNV